MNLLGFLLMIPIAIDEKTFSSALAFIANQFTVLFNYVPLTVTDCTNHFSPPVSSTYDAIKPVALTDLAYTPVLCGWQVKIWPIKNGRLEQR
jgi:hypothetical protein